jgi:SAM-dependent methyltransferase
MQAPGPSGASTRPADTGPPAAGAGDRAGAYDAWYQTPLGAAAHRIEQALIAEAARPLPGERALDAGCGTGIYTAWLTALGLEVTGIDRDPAMLAAARRKAPGARLVEGDVRRLPFADGEFDLVLAVTLFCVLDTPARASAARELVRVSRPGGRIVIGELAPFSLWAAGRRLRAWLGSRAWAGVRFATATELCGLLRAAGASATSARHGLYLPPLAPRALIRHADALERIARPFGPFGAGFVAVRASR